LSSQNGHKNIKEKKNTQKQFSYQKLLTGKISAVILRNKFWKNANFFIPNTE
jgi:hypothetical protein